MKAKKQMPKGLNTPNDPSPGQCYAPVDKNQNPILEKKKHIKEGQDPPKDWKQVPCEGCQG